MGCVIPLFVKPSPQNHPQNSWNDTGTQRIMIKLMDSWMQRGTSELIHVFEKMTLTGECRKVYNLCPLGMQA